MAAKATPIRSEATDLQSKCTAITDAVRRAHRERDDQVEVVMLSVLTANHPMFLGPPGSGKSMLTRDFVACIEGASYFETLLTKFTTEDEVCGPIKLSALKQDRVERATDGMLPAVNFAFVDETFKGNSSILNALLGIMNERVYRGVRCPLWTMFGASNELPEDETTLAAMWDRWLLRTYFDYIQSDAEWDAFIEEAADGAEKPFVPPCKLSLDEILAAHDMVHAVVIPAPVRAELRKLKHKLLDAGIVVSDRRWKNCLPVLKAAAWLDGDAKVSPDHLFVLRHALWIKPDDREKVNAALKAIDKSAVGKALDVIDDALRGYAERPVAEEEYFKVLPKLVDDLAQTGKTIMRMTEEGGFSKRALRKLAPRMAEMDAAHSALKSDMSKRYGL